MEPPHVVSAAAAPRTGQPGLSADGGGLLCPGTRRGCFLGLCVLPSPRAPSCLSRDRAVCRALSSRPHSRQPARVSPAGGPPLFPHAPVRQLLGPSGPRNHFSGGRLPTSCGLVSGPGPRGRLLGGRGLSGQGLGAPGRGWRCLTRGQGPGGEHRAAPALACAPLTAPHAAWRSHGPGSASGFPWWVPTGHLFGSRLPNGMEAQGQLRPGCWAPCSPG